MLLCIHVPWRRSDLWLSYQEVPFEMYIGMEEGEIPSGACAGRATKYTPSSKYLTTSLCVWLFTYRRSCFRPLCLPWCHPAASGGRSRVCSKVVWRCPSAGALQSKHRVKYTLESRNTRTQHTLKCTYAHQSMSTHTDLTRGRSWYLLCEIVKQWSVCACMCVCETVAFSRIDGSLVSAKKHFFRDGFKWGIQDVVCVDVCVYILVCGCL